MAATKQEKAMLRTAKKLRKLVHADFMTKTANPAVAMAARALFPALRSLGPKILQTIGPMLKNPQFWMTVGPMLADMLAGGGEQEGQAENAKQALSRVALAATKSGCHPDHVGTVARAFVVATIETRNAHKKEANPTVAEAIRLGEALHAEMKVIKEFM